jgi:UDP-glucuronate 4-epimerase
MRILITGAAGSIGAATLNSLKESHELLGIDNYNDYYSPTYKNERVKSFNLTSQIKNINICNARKDYCSARIILDHNGSTYVIERQTTKSTNNKRQK